MSKEIVFAVEKFSDVYDEAGNLLNLHWQEIAKNKELLRLNPDAELYKSIENDLMLVTARSGGALIGYFLWIFRTHPHYKHVLVAEEDLHFLLKEYRLGLAGYKFIKAACRSAINRGAKLLVMREKIGNEHPAIMKRLNFIPTDVVYTHSVESPT